MQHNFELLRYQSFNYYNIMFKIEINTYNNGVDLSPLNW